MEYMIYTLITSFEIQKKKKTLNFFLQPGNIYCSLAVQYSFSILSRISPSLNPPYPPILNSIFDSFPGFCTYIGGVFYEELPLANCFFIGS